MTSTTCIWDREANVSILRLEGSQRHHNRLVAFIWKHRRGPQSVSATAAHITAGSPLDVSPAVPRFVPLIFRVYLMFIHGGYNVACK